MTDSKLKAYKEVLREAIHLLINHGYTLNEIISKLNIPLYISKELGLVETYGNM
jgi:uncharacterized protein YaaR (DUF327 family)